MRLQPCLLLGICALAAACTDGGSPPEPGSAAGSAGSGGVNATSGGSAVSGSPGGGTASGGDAGGATGGSSGGQGGNTSAGGGGASAGNGGTASAGFRLPPANAAFDYQIGGAYPPAPDVKVVSRDRGESPASGLYNICYVNGFQAQPAEDDWWESEHPELLLRDAQNNPVIDEDWDEMLLDTSTDEKRQALVAIVGGWIQECGAKGFDAIEIDNLDSYSRSGGLLSEADNVALMKALSQVAHGSDLAMGQKNSAELVSQAGEMGTDFAVAEECNRYVECADYQSAYGNLVFVIEYRDEDFSAGCASHPELSIVRRDVDVSTPGSDGYVYEGC